jgi:hypothetical protein
MLVLSLGAAWSNFMGYSEWAAMSVNARALYIAGAFDTLVSIVSPNPNDIGTAIHYQTCLTDSKMTNKQLADNIVAYASSHPHLQKGTVQTANA